MRNHSTSRTSLQAEIGLEIDQKSENAMGKIPKQFEQVVVDQMGRKASEMQQNHLEWQIHIYQIGCTIVPLGHVGPLIEDQKVLV
jgi:hypothetical protein